MPVDVKWFADEHAKRVHLRVSELMKQVVAELCPNHELSHLGINRNNDTEEVILKLHLNPIGRVRVVGDGPIDYALLSQSVSGSSEAEGDKV